MLRSVISRAWRPVTAAAVGVCAFAGMTTPAPASTQPRQTQAAASGYLNLHQCVYYSPSASNHFTTAVPGNDGRFTTGTNVSNTADTQVSCGARAPETTRSLLSCRASSRSRWPEGCPTDLGR